MRASLVPCHYHYKLLDYLLYAVLGVKKQVVKYLQEKRYNFEKTPLNQVCEHLCHSYKITCIRVYQIISQVHANVQQQPIAEIPQFK